MPSSEALARARKRPFISATTATITATMAGGYTQTCKVYNSVTSGSGSSSGSESSASGSAKSCSPPA